MKFLVLAVLIGLIASFALQPRARLVFPDYDNINNTDEFYFARDFRSASACEEGLAIFRALPGQQLHRLDAAMPRATMCGHHGAQYRAPPGRLGWIFFRSNDAWLKPQCNLFSEPASADEVHPVPLAPSRPAYLRSPGLAHPGLLLIYQPSSRALPTAACRCSSEQGVVLRLSFDRRKPFGRTSVIDRRKPFGRTSIPCSVVASMQQVNFPTCRGGFKT